MPLYQGTGGRIYGVFVVVPEIYGLLATDPNPRVAVLLFALVCILVGTRVPVVYPFAQQ